MSDEWVKARSPEEALDMLERRRREIEEEIGRLKDLLDKGDISREEFEKSFRRLEREYVEVMDRITQLRFISTSFVKT